MQRDQATCLQIRITCKTTGINATTGTSGYRTLVALINRRDRYHQWATIEVTTIQMPLLTCEAVISEAYFLLQRANYGQEALVGLLKQKLIQIPFHFDREVDTIGNLLNRYRSVPMSVADACLMRMAELYAGSFILTTDRDFQIYRISKNQVIPVIMPLD